MSTELLRVLLVVAVAAYLLLGRYQRAGRRRLGLDVAAVAADQAQLGRQLGRQVAGLATAAAQLASGQKGLDGKIAEVRGGVDTARAFAVAATLASLGTLALQLLR